MSRMGLVITPPQSVITPRKAGGGPGTGGTTGSGTSGTYSRVGDGGERQVSRRLPKPPSTPCRASPVACTGVTRPLHGRHSTAARASAAGLRLGRSVRAERLEAQVGDERVRHKDRAVMLLVVLQDGGHGPAD